MTAPSAPSPSWWPSPDPTGLQPALTSHQPGGLPGGPCWGPGPLGSLASLRMAQPLSPNVEYRLWTWAGVVGMAWTHPMKGENGPSRNRAIIEHRLCAGLDAGHGYICGTRGLSRPCPPWQAGSSALPLLSRTWRFLSTHLAVRSSHLGD